MNSITAASSARKYQSPLRQRQAEATRQAILDATSALIEELGGAEQVSNKAIAERAGVTEMTLYRHFPRREPLLEAVWMRMNTARGVKGGFPEHIDDIVGRLGELFASFDAAPSHIQSVLTTAAGRELRASRDGARRDAFLGVLRDAFPALGQEDRIQAAAMLQLIYSAYTWLSLRDQWGLSGERAADAARWAARTLLDDLARRGDLPLSHTCKEHP